MAARWFYVIVRPQYAPHYEAIARVCVPAGPDLEFRAKACGAIVTRVCLRRYGLIPKENP